jgi:endonuclease V-like protein UPF0215 family
MPNLENITAALKNIPAAEREALRQLRKPSELSSTQLKSLVAQVKGALAQSAASNITQSAASNITQSVSPESDAAGI